MLMITRGLRQAINPMLYSWSSSMTPSSSASTPSLSFRSRDLLLSGSSFFLRGLSVRLTLVRLVRERRRSPLPSASSSGPSSNPRSSMLPSKPGSTPSSDFFLDRLVRGAAAPERRCFFSPSASSRPSPLSDPAFAAASPKVANDDSNWISPLAPQASSPSKTPFTSSPDASPSLTSNDANISVALAFISSDLLSPNALNASVEVENAASALASGRAEASPNLFSNVANSESTAAADFFRRAAAEFGSSFLACGAFLASFGSIAKPSS
mmetsp:Transcript_8851/g.18367  ORF Transcript_8851/g.18367 Transcript_8851/m.18367 type:complete len:268 (-) Transcript_8851:798-1601(-)